MIHKINTVLLCRHLGCHNCSMDSISQVYSLVKNISVSVCLRSNSFRLRRPTRDYKWTREGAWVLSQWIVSGSNGCVRVAWSRPPRRGLCLPIYRPWGEQVTWERKRKDGAVFSSWSWTPQILLKQTFARRTPIRYRRLTWVSSAGHVLTAKIGTNRSDQSRHCGLSGRDRSVWSVGPTGPSRVRVQLGFFIDLDL